LRHNGFVLARTNIEPFDRPGRGTGVNKKTEICGFDLRLCGHLFDLAWFCGITRGVLPFFPRHCFNPWLPLFSCVPTIVWRVGIAIVSLLIAFDNGYGVYELRLIIVNLIAGDSQACSWCLPRRVEECFGWRAACFLSGGCGTAPKCLAREFGLPLVTCA
jgi:hypothetical protein